MEPLLASLLSLDDRSAVVTGAGSATGEAIAHLLAAAGARVVVADADLDAAARVASEIALLGHRAEAVRADIGDAGSAAELVAQAVRLTGRLDVLVAHGDAGDGPAPILEQSVDDWRRAVTAGLDGLFCCARAAAGHWASVGDGGVIVSVGPLGGVARGGVAQDSVSAAMVQFTRTLALDLAPHRVRVNAVATRLGNGTGDGIGEQTGAGPAEGAGTAIGSPAAGTVDAAPMTGRSVRSGLDGERLRWRAAQLPLGHAGMPADVAKAVLFLSSELSSYVTGQTLTVDGGWTLL
jgi:NAD(P)-dependent dehydrogenase (short-subunit alcohol dehydrogenase family)